MELLHFDYPIVATEDIEPGYFVILSQNTCKVCPINREIPHGFAHEAFKKGETGAVELIHFGQYKKGGCTNGVKN